MISSVEQAWSLASVFVQVISAWMAVRIMFEGHISHCKITLYLCLVHGLWSRNNPTRRSKLAHTVSLTYWQDLWIGENDLILQNQKPWCLAGMFNDACALFYEFVKNKDTIVNLPDVPEVRLSDKLVYFLILKKIKWAPVGGNILPCVDSARVTQIRTFFMTLDGNFLIPTCLKYFVSRFQYNVSGQMSVIKSIRTIII